MRQQHFWLQPSKSFKCHPCSLRISSKAHSMQVKLSIQMSFRDAWSIGKLRGLSQIGLLWTMGWKCPSFHLPFLFFFPQVLIKTITEVFQHTLKWILQLWSQSTTTSFSLNFDFLGYPHLQTAFSTRSVPTVILRKEKQERTGLL